MTREFHVDLRGIVDLLSHHLYSGPAVVVRELLQNGADALLARSRLEPGHQGSVEIEVVTSSDGSPPTLVVQDDGIGLTADEVAEFLATVGRSSKRGHDDQPSILEDRTDYIGQFGIGLLSAFLVADEVVVHTRSARDRAAPAVAWHGRADGTYDLDSLAHQPDPGTTVYLRAREGSEDWFEPESIARLCRSYGELLPFEIRVRATTRDEVITRGELPWRVAGDAEHRREVLLEYGREVFGVELLDALPLSVPAGAIEGVAFLLAESPRPGARPPHRVYLRRMLLTDHGDRLLPDWAFFVLCVVNAEQLRPTASREDLHDDAELDAAREQLGLALRAHLIEMAHRDPARLQRLIAVHHLAMKLLAASDDEFLSVIGDWLPFETNFGRLTLEAFRQRVAEGARGGAPIRYTRSVETFRQVAQVAAAQGIGVVNGGYDLGADVLERAVTVLDGFSALPLEPGDLLGEFDALDDGEAARFAPFLEAARTALERFGCDTQVRTFEPWSIPCLYTSDEGTRRRRALEDSRSMANPLFSGVLESLRRDDPDRPAVCFNAANPLVGKLADLATGTSGGLLEHSVELLYTQSLLLGQHALRSEELGVLTGSLLDLIEWSVDQAGGTS